MQGEYVISSIVGLGTRNAEEEAAACRPCGRGLEGGGRAMPTFVTIVLDRARCPLIVMQMSSHHSSAMRSSLRSLQSDWMMLSYLSVSLGRYDADTETSFPHERPPSPVFMPAYSGSDVATQILDGDFFDFDKEVVAVEDGLWWVGSLLGGTGIGGHCGEDHREGSYGGVRGRGSGGYTEATGWVGYDRGAAWEGLLSRFQALRHAELLEAQRMEGVEKRRSYERERRRTQEHMRITTEGVGRGGGSAGMS